MSRFRFAAMVAVAVAPFASPPADAQVIFGPGMQGVPDRAIEGRATERDDITTCYTSGGGSRVKSACEPEQTRLQYEQELKLSLKVPALQSLQCGASTTTQYEQLNTFARVDSKLSIADCTAASGGFTVAVRVRDENGEEKLLEFTETWERSDAEDVHFASEYWIGENADLMSVRLRELQCTCADLPKEEQATAEGP